MKKIMIKIIMFVIEIIYNIKGGITYCKSYL